MRLHRISADLEDADYIALSRGKILVRNLFSLKGMPTNSQVVSWLLRSVPWIELEGSVADQAGGSRHAPLD